MSVVRTGMRTADMHVRRGTTSSGTTTACSWGEVGTALKLRFQRLKR